MSAGSNPKPRLSLLGEEDMHRAHEASLRILAKVGVRVDSPVARDTLHRAGAVFPDESRCLIAEDVVAAAVASVPVTFPVYRRTGEYAFTCGNGPATFGVGVTNLHYEEPATGEIVSFRREHMATATRLGHALEAYDLVSTAGIVHDEPVARADLVATLEMAANTTKPLVLLVSDGEQFVPALEMLAEIADLSGDAPFVLSYVNPITPLALNADTTDKMAAAIARGLPVIFSNYGMAGASTPMSPIGTLALLNAELLAGLVFGQAVRPGAKMVLGSLPAYFDMRTMVDYYDPRSMLVNLACSEMMAWHGIPHAGTSGSGNGWGPDVITAGELWFNHLVSCLGAAGLVPFVGGNLGSKVFSPASVVYSADVIAQARVFARGISWEDEAGLVDEIAAVKAGGSFFESPQTLRRFRSGYHTSTIFPHYSLEKWQEEGQPAAERRLRERTVAITRSAAGPEDHADVLGRGEAWLARRA